MHRLVWASTLLGLFLASPTWAADKADQEIRSTILKTAENWSTLNPDSNDSYYDQGSQAVYFDVAPMRYAGWTSYKEGFKKAFAGFRDFKLTLNNDLAVHHVGKFGWATTTWKADGHLQDGKEVHLEGRATLVLEKKKGKWIVLHEHYSVPGQM